jgi:hypothetical protein
MLLKSEKTILPLINWVMFNGPYKKTKISLILRLLNFFKKYKTIIML